MPVRDTSPYLGQAIDSIINQTFTDFELIAIEKRSGAGSSAMLRSYEQRDPRVRIVAGTGSGVAGELNEGLELARAPLIALMCSDGIALRGRLHVQYRAFEADPHLWVLG